MDVRITRTGRRHHVSGGKLRRILADAILVRMDGEDMAIYEGVDENGFKWELGLVPDDKNPERLALVHAEPILWKRGKL